MKQLKAKKNPFFEQSDFFHPILLKYNVKLHHLVYDTYKNIFENRLK